MVVSGNAKSKEITIESLHAQIEDVLNFYSSLLEEKSGDANCFPTHILNSHHRGNIQDGDKSCFFRPPSDFPHFPPLFPGEKMGIRKG